jgi:hypothetical protein
MGGRLSGLLGSKSVIIVSSGSLSPDVANALVSHRCVNNRIRDRAMAHKGLQRPCINPAGVEFIDENGGGLDVRFRKPRAKEPKKQR